MNVKKRKIIFNVLMLFLMDKIFIINIIIKDRKNYDLDQVFDLRTSFLV